MNYLGIDLAKESFQVAFPTPKAYQVKAFTNDEQGFDKLYALLDKDSVLVMEATGAYFLCLAHFLSQQGFKVCVVNPLSVKRFAQMSLQRTKTDKSDACLIARYGALVKPAFWQPESNFITSISQEQTLLEALIKQRTALKNQLEALNQHPVISEKALAILPKQIGSLDEPIAELEKEIESKVVAGYQDLFKILCSIPGIGAKTAIALLVLTRGFTRFNNAKQLSAYVGLAPRIFESGTSVKGKSHLCKLGNSSLRSLLYLCTWTARRTNQACKEMFERLIAKGKPKKVAAMALANKLLKQAFAMAKSGKLYQAKQNLVTSPTFA